MTHSTIFTNHRTTALLTAVLMNGLGCGMAAAPDPGSSIGPAPASAPLAPPSSIPVSERIAGYRHAFANSRFKLGASPASISEMGFSKIVGEEGTFAVDELNGAVLALPNADSPASKRPPFAGRGVDHNAQVRAYFLAGGIPADQIASVEVHAMMEGSMTASGTRNPDKLIGYYSVLSRAIAGVPVAESYAWARFNADGDVVDESVYWPELPGAARSSAKELLATTGEPTRAQLMLKAIESSHPGFGNSTGRIVIHHNLATNRDALWTVATYDSLTAGGKSTLHFDQAGQRVVLAHELASAARTAH